MSRLPAAQPTARVSRDARDDRYNAGHPTPGKRATSGVVLSIQGDTVTMDLGECDPVTGVIPLGAMPAVGDLVEVEARGDLLVIPAAAEVVEDPWLNLPDVIRVMVPNGCTTDTGTNGWNPLTSEYALWNMRLSIYNINGPVFNPVQVYLIGAAWNCAWAHASNGDEGSPYWNNPPTRTDWSGSAICEPLHPVGTIAAAAPSGTVVGCGWDMSASASGSQDALQVRSRQLSLWVNLAQCITSHLNLTQNGGLPPPTPPTGYRLEWERSGSALLRVEARVTEAVASVPTNEGTIYLDKITPPFHEFGPASDTDTTVWNEGGGYTGGEEFLPAFSGETAPPWIDVTANLNTTGKTWLMFVSDVIHEGASHGETTPGNPVAEFRYNIHVAFRFTVRPSRYRFVPL